MARKTVRKKKKRRMKLTAFTAVFFLLSGLLYLTSCLFLRSYNNTLSTQTQQIQSEIDTLQTQNEAVSVEVNNLNNKDRVSGIAADSGLSLDQDNIVTITKTTDGE